MLNVLPAAGTVPPDTPAITLSHEFKSDVRWWYVFMGAFNGVSIIAELSWSSDTFSSDACERGCGAFHSGKYFHAPFPPHTHDLPIHIKEMVAILLAVKLWGFFWGGKRIIYECDNMVSVYLINTSRSRDPWMQACIRELWYLAAMYSFELKATHIQGVNNRLADHLSRWDLSIMMGHR